MNPDFSQRPFAAGSLFGVRSFRVTREGVLTGVVQQEPWAAGVNEAICRRGSVTNLAAAMNQMGMSAAEAAWSFHQMACSLSGKVNLRKRPKQKQLALDPEPHQAGTLDCTCGFYAYFDEGHNPHHDSGQVLGIIEGFGVCTTGTRGFRSSKARLRALVAGWFPLDAVSANYPDVPIFPTLAAALAEFPLTPVEGAVKPAPVMPAWGGRTVSYTMNVDMSGVSKAFADLLRGVKPLPKPQDERSRWERAMRARRERNTGPPPPRLDGRRR